MMKSQQDRIENNNALADDLKSQLSLAESKLATLQGNSSNCLFSCEKTIATKDIQTFFIFHAGTEMCVFQVKQKASVGR